MNNFQLSLLIFITTLSYSQKYELGEVTIQELQEKVCPSDTSAVAAFYFNIGKTYFTYNSETGFDITTEIITKIKIYKKEGYELANKAVEYYIGGNGNDKVSFSKANTFNLINGKIEKTKLKSDGEFDENLNKYWSRKKITMPNVKEGAIIEYMITVKSPRIYNFPDWVFQKNVPVFYSEYTSIIPEYFTYNTHMRGYFTPIIEKNSKSRTVDYSFYKQNLTGQNVRLDERINSNMEFQENSVKYIIKDIPALKNEGYVNNIDNYRAILSHELTATRNQSGQTKIYSKDWDNVVKEIYDDPDFGEELNKTSYFEKDIDQILTGITQNGDRMNAIFNYVKSIMNWNEYYGYSCDIGVKKAYQERKGNAAEINLMLTAILRYAGFNANPVLLSTRENGIAFFPTITGYNYVICGLEAENQVILMDATSKYSSPNIIPMRDLNWFGRIIRKNGSSAEIDLMPKNQSKEVINIMASIDKDANVSGKIRDQYYDYNAYLFRSRYNGKTKESAIERIEKQYDGIEVEEYDVQNNENLSLPIIESYSFSHSNLVEVIADKMYFSPLLLFQITENPFKQDKREYPVDFGFPQQDRYVVSINIPDGYTVETLPQSAAIALPEDKASFKYNVSSNGNQIQLMYTLDIKEAIISPDFYESLKNFYKELVIKHTDKIVLRKG